MRDLLDHLLTRWRAGQPVGLAVVTATWASAPRPPGSAMLVDADAVAVGSVSGGCVEADVYQRCREVLTSGVAQTVRYGVSDDDAVAVGLPCGGTIELFVCRVDPQSFPALPELAEALGAAIPVAVLSCVDGPPSYVGRHLVLTATARHGSLSPSPAPGLPGPPGADRIDDAVADDGRGMLAAGRTGLLHYGPAGQRRGTGLSVLVTSFAPAARLLVVGATDHAAAVARIGAFLGYRVTVCDARRVFATAARFPDAHDVVVDWPHRYLSAEAAAGRLDDRTVVCVLTHDPKFDVPVLEVALGLPLAYVGAMGSRRTHDERLKRLREAGLAPAALARLASPIGLDLGARTPEETAVSIAAEIVALRWGGTGARLGTAAGPIHPDRSDVPDVPRFPSAVRRDIGTGPRHNQRMYLIRERFFDIGDDFDITDGDGNTVYHVDGKVLSMRNKLVIEDTAGQEVASVHRHLIAMRATYEITIGGQQAAEVRKKLFTPFRETFTIDIPGPHDLQIKGDLLDHEFAVERDGTEVASVSKKWFTVRDTYGVRVAPGEDDLLILASVLAMELAMAKEKKDDQKAEDR